MITQLIILALIGSTLAQTTTVASKDTTTTLSVTTALSPTTTSTTTSTTTTTTTTTTPMSSPSSSSSSPSADVIPSTASPITSRGLTVNCSACLQSFYSIYLNSSSSEDHWNESVQCPPVGQLNDSCVSIVSDNCSDIVNLLYTVNSNLSFGLTCSMTGLRVVKWKECINEPETIRMINESNVAFCRMGDFNYSVDSNGIRRINKVNVLEPFRKKKFCSPPTTSRPTIPLLPNPVGPGAITAIVVLVCLFIVAVLAGFFFWPKCHMSKPPPPTPKKKQPPPTVEAFNVVAYSAASASPTGAANVSISSSQMARGPAAA